MRRADDFVDFVVILTRTHHPLLELGFLKGIPIATISCLAARSSAVCRDTNFCPARRDLTIENDFVRLGLSSGIESSLEVLGTFRSVAFHVIEVDNYLAALIIVHSVGLDYHIYRAISAL